jgi:hypothetical protein
MNRLRRLWDRLTKNRADTELSVAISECQAEISTYRVLVTALLLHHGETELSQHLLAAAEACSFRANSTGGGNGIALTLHAED